MPGAPSHGQNRGLAVGAADQAPRACDSAHGLTGKERAISRLVAPGSRVTSEPDPTTVSRSAPFIRSEPCVCRRVRGWDLEFEIRLERGVRCELDPAASATCLPASHAPAPPRKSAVRCVWPWPAGLQSPRLVTVPAASPLTASHAREDQSPRRRSSDGNRDSSAQSLRVLQACPDRSSRRLLWRMR